MANAEKADEAEWMDTAFEQVDQCLFCHTEGHVPAVADVADFFFECVPFASDFARCEQCDSLLQTTRLKAEFLHHAYTSYYTHADQGGGMSASSIKGRLRRDYLAIRFGGKRTIFSSLGAAVYRAAGGNVEETDAALRFAPAAPARVLDYGCGGGAYLGRLAALGYDLTGVDFDPVSVAKVREAGIAAFDPGEIPSEDWQGAFDAITLGHVIEHVYDPVGLLTQLRGWLAPGGMIYIEVPNAMASGLDIFGKYWRGLEAPRHLGIPSLEGMRTALAKAGLGIERTIVRKPVRAWMWEESLQASPAGQHGTLKAAMVSAPELTAANAEFLTLVARPQA